jgi:tellurite resistance protein
MQIDASPAQARTILKAMHVVAAAGPAVTAADRASIVAAARYIFKLEVAPDLAGLTPAATSELEALAANPQLAAEAVSFATVMALVDGTLDQAKLAAVLNLAATLGVKADFVNDVAEVAQGHLRDATAHMIRANMESITGKPWTTDGDAMAWFLPYKGANADPKLAARFHALVDLPQGSFGRAFATFYLSQKYAFPGEEQALNFRFATSHDSSHLLAGYDTTPRGELLVSTFTARHAPQRSHVGPRAAGNLQLASRHRAQRACRLRQGRPRLAGVLARLGARRAYEDRPVRPGLGLLDGNAGADRVGACARRRHRMIDSFASRARAVH